MSETKAASADRAGAREPIDLHARQMYVCLMDRQGKILVHTNVRNNDFAFFLKLVEPYRHDLTVRAECMFGWHPWEQQLLGGEDHPIRQLALQNELTLVRHFDEQIIFRASAPAASPQKTGSLNSNQT